MRGVMLLILMFVAPTSCLGDRLLIVSGLGGETFYSELFHRWSNTLMEVSVTELGMSPRSVVYLNEAPDEHTPTAAAISTKQNIENSLKTIASEIQPDEALMVVMIGHGSANASRVSFNIPGPDLQAEELSTMLEVFSGHEIAIVNTSPSSAPFVDTLSAPGRIVVTATASASENQHTHFGGYFVSAFAESGADADKDKKVSLLEAFVFAKRETEKFFRTEQRILTEHAQIDSDGDGKAAMELEATHPDAIPAGKFVLGPGYADDNNPDRKQMLRLDIAARQLVDRIETLKRSKTTQHEDEYHDALEKLLVELALNRREYREFDKP